MLYTWTKDDESTRPSFSLAVFPAHISRTTIDPVNFRTFSGCARMTFFLEISFVHNSNNPKLFLICHVITSSHQLLLISTVNLWIVICTNFMYAFLESVSIPCSIAFHDSPPRCVSLHFYKASISFPILWLLHFGPHMAVKINWPAHLPARRKGSVQSNLSTLSSHQILALCGFDWHSFPHLPPRMGQQTFQDYSIK